jgi:hypothetical protein
MRRFALPNGRVTSALITVASAIKKNLAVGDITKTDRTRRISANHISALIV